MAYTIRGNLSNNGESIHNGFIELQRNDGTVLDSDFTDPSGNYLLSASDTSQNVVVVVDPGGPHETTSASLTPDEHTNVNFTNPPNSDPTLPPLSDIQETENTGSHDYDTVPTDADGIDLLTFEKITGPSWLILSHPDNTPAPYLARRTIDTDGVSPGVYSASVRIKDTWNGVSPTRNFLITILDDNQPPVLTNPGTQNFQNNDGIKNFQLVANDPESGPLTFAKTVGPSWVTVSSSGSVGVDTDAATRGPHSVTARVTDDGGLFDTETFTISINNNAPVLVNPGELKFTSGVGIQTFQLSASDLDLDTLAFSKTAGDGFVTVSSSGLLSVDTSVPSLFIREDFEGTGIPSSQSGTYSIQGGGTTDFDFDRTLVTGAPASWGDESFKSTQASGVSYLRFDPTSSLLASTYVKFEVVIEAGPDVDSTYKHVFELDGEPSTWLVIWRLFKTTAGLEWRVHNRNSAGGFSFPYNALMSLDTKYKVEIEWVKATSLKVWLDDSLIVNETDILNENIRWFDLGIVEGPSTTPTKIFHVDNYEYISPPPQITIEVDDGNGGTDEVTFNVVLEDPEPSPMTWAVT